MPDDDNDHVPVTTGNLRRSIDFERVLVEHGLPTGDQRIVNVARARHGRSFAAAALYADLNDAIGRAVVATESEMRATNGFVVVFDTAPLLPVVDVDDEAHETIMTGMQLLFEQLYVEHEWEEDAMRWTPDRGAEEIEAWQQLLRQRRSR